MSHLQKYSLVGVQWFVVGMLVLLIGTFVTSSAKAALYVDGSVFSDDFDGSTFSPSWNVTVWGGGACTVAGDGTAIIASDSPLSAGAVLWSDNDLLSGLGDDYGFEVRFKVGSLTGENATRDWILMQGRDNVPASGDWGGSWNVLGIDFRLNPYDDDHFNLDWWGWDGSSRIPSAVASGLLYGEWHTVIGHRKTDDTVDIYLNDNLVGNKPVIWDVNPTVLMAGDAAGGDAGLVTYDYMRVGSVVVPEPSSMVLTFLAGLGLMAYTWRRRK